jgi:hypothetical protein
MDPLRRMLPLWTPKLLPIEAFPAIIKVPPRTLLKEDELMIAPSELEPPSPVALPAPPKPLPEMLNTSFVLKPFRSRTAPLATVVIPKVPPSAPALPSLSKPEVTEILPINVAELSEARVTVFGPVLKRVKADPTFTIPSNRMSP